MEFIIDTSYLLDINDLELTELLTQVYVEGGFVTREEAASLFEPSAVRKRGILIGAREISKSTLAGIVIIVPPDSHTCRLAQDNEVEMHLLGIKPEYRRYGLGGKLVDATIDRAKQAGFSKMILWTQITMNAAQHLYKSKGFVHTRDIDRNGRDFRVYEHDL